MKKYLFILMAVMLSGMTAFAQSLSEGFYRVQNYGSSRYLYVRDCTGDVSTLLDMGAIELWSGQEKTISDPSSVVYLKNVGGLWDIQSQGTGVKEITDHYMSISYDGKFAQVYASGQYLYEVGTSDLYPDKGIVGAKTSSEMPGQTNYRLWKMHKIDASGDNYFGFKPVVSAGGKHYLPFYADFAYTTKSEDIRTWYVTMVDKKNAVAVIATFKGTVAAKQPVFIETTSANPSGNKVEISYGNGSKLTDNILLGVMFSNGPRNSRTHKGTPAFVKFDSKTMRVLDKDASGNLVFTNSTSTLATTYDSKSRKDVTCIPANYSYLTVDSDCPANLKLVTQEEYERLYSKTYTLIYKIDGEVYKTYTHKAGDEITPEAAPEKEGYTFSGWSTIPSIMPNQNVEVTGSFTVNKYKITFDTDGGSNIAPLTFNYGDPVSAPANPVKSGYTFSGWSPALPETMPAEGITVKALWTAQAFTITFDTDGGSVVSPVVQQYGTAVTAPADPTRTGYEFVGWDRAIPETMPAENITIKALWKVRQFTITFDTDGGSTIALMTKDYGADITAPADPVKAGYVFKGWKPKLPATMPAENLTVKAQWTEAEFTITFDTDGGSAIAPLVLKFGAAVTVPANPTKTGYTFAGWDQGIPKTMPAQNLTIKARWNINQYTITFDTDGGSAIAPIRQNYGVGVSAPADPMRTGYTFAGWEQEIPKTMPAQDLTIKARWNINQYTITFDTDGGSKVAPVTLDYNSSVTAPSSPTKTGYSFAGWDKEIPSVMPAENLTIKALWTINQYTITFDTDGGSRLAPITQDYNSAVTAPDAPTKTGYTFAGWDQEVPKTMPAENITIKAQWTINSYKLTYKVDGKVYKEYTTTYNAVITPEANPEKEGYVFSGWSEIPQTMPDHDVVVNGSFTTGTYSLIYMVDGQKYKEYRYDYEAVITPETEPTKTGYTFSGWDKTVPAKMPASDLTISGTFKVNRYTITFDTDGGSEIASITQDYNSAVTAPAEPTKTGYSFAGWDKQIPTHMPAEDMTIKALWTINQYTVTFDTDGGSIIASITQDYNSDVTAPADPTRTGYTFAGWDRNIPSVMPAENFTIKAMWTINRYTITYDTDGGSEIRSVTQDYNSAVTAPSAPTKTGYTFYKWDKEIPTRMPAEDLTIKALWTVNQYTITFDTDGAGDMAPLSFDYGADVKITYEPSKTGYTFSGWNLEVPATMPAYDFSLKALWKVNKYTITFDTDGGSEVEAVTREYGSSVSSPRDPSRTGYTFAGWDQEIPKTMPAEDMTIKALWTINQYTITFDTDGGSKIAPLTLDYGSLVTAPEDPVRTGYTFSGWSPEVPDSMPAKDLILKAQWTVNQYTITFDTDGGTEIAPITLNYDARIVAPANPTKVGHSFAGWDQEIPARMPAQDLTFKALWTVHHYMVTYRYKKATVHRISLAYGEEIPEYEYTPESTEDVTYTFVEWQENGVTFDLETMPDRAIVLDAVVTFESGINHSFTDPSDGRVEIYDLSGNRVTTPQKGQIYIVNRKKMVLR